MKNNRYDIEMLSAYLDGELSPKEKIFIEEKIKSSIELQNKLKELKALKSLTSEAKPHLESSVYFETRLFAELNSHNHNTVNLKKLIPVFSFSGLAVVLIFLFSINPTFINRLLEKQETNLVDFYKSNLKPLLYASNITSEDVFNFALNEEIPLDPSKNQTLKLGYDQTGKEFFEIKQNANLKSENNLNNFVAALDLNEYEQKQMDSLLNAYSEKISSQILVGDKNAVAINPNLWNVRKAVLADILAFAKKYGDQKFLKIAKVNSFPSIEENVVWIEKVKSVSPKDFIVCTPDTVFSTEIDLAELDKDLRKASEELKNMNKQLKQEFYFSIRSDSNNSAVREKIKTNNNFRVFVHNSGVQVHLEQFEMPEIILPNFDSIASVINEATRNHLILVKSGNSDLSQNPQNGDKQQSRQGYFYSQPKNREVNVDSVIEQNNKRNEIINRRKQTGNIRSDSASNEIKVMIDSLLIRHNEEIRKQIDQLRKEIEKFRQDMKNMQNQEKIDQYEEMIKRLEEQIEI